MDEIKVLNHGFVRFEGHMGGDLSVVNSARVSFGKRKESVGYEDEQLINYLMKNRHGTPFEHNTFTFHCKCPIFVMREWIRHRISSFNEFSMRYTEAPAEWYIPAAEDVRTQVGKPGHYVYEQTSEYMSKVVQIEIAEICKNAFESYQGMLNAGIAKELARAVLPVAMYTEFYWTVNARSLMNFLSLRWAPTALLEIRKYAEVIAKDFEREMPATYDAWIGNEKVAP
jgi:thymidylate synthase (FAD)